MDVDAPLARWSRRRRGPSAWPDCQIKIKTAISNGPWLHRPQCPAPDGRATSRQLGGFRCCRPAGFEVSGNSPRQRSTEAATGKVRRDFPPRAVGSVIYSGRWEVPTRDTATQGSGFVTPRPKYGCTSWRSRHGRWPTRPHGSPPLSHPRADTYMPIPPAYAPPH
jgi:hypothetical protein